MKTRILCILVLVAFAAPAFASNNTTPLCCPSTATYPEDLDIRPTIDAETLTVSESKLIGSWKMIDYNHTISNLVQWDFNSDGTFVILDSKTQEEISEGTWELSRHGDDLTIMEYGLEDKIEAFQVRDLGFHTLNLYNTKLLDANQPYSMFFEKI